MMSEPYHRKEVLEGLHVEQELTQKEIAERFGVTPQAINKWIKKLGVERPPEPFQDPEVLEHLYWDEGLSTTEIGERFGVHKDTVQKRMDSFGIPRRSNSEAQKHRNRDAPANFFTSKQGYERVQSATENGKCPDVVGVHRLIAVAEYGVESVSGMHVHHRNGIPWDNRPSNLEVMSAGDHARLHAINQPKNSRGQWS